MVTLSYYPVWKSIYLQNISGTLPFLSCDRIKLKPALLVLLPIRAEKIILLRKADNSKTNDIDILSNNG